MRLLTDGVCTKLLTQTDEGPGPLGPPGDPTFEPLQPLRYGFKTRFTAISVTFANSREFGERHVKRVVLPRDRRNPL
jgi:hypothetical protein